VRGEPPPTEDQRREEESDLEGAGPPQDLVRPEPDALPEPGGPPTDLMAPEKEPPPPDLAAELTEETAARHPPEDVYEAVQEQITMSIQEAIDDALPSDELDVDVLQKISESLRDVDSKGFSALSGFLSNPLNYMQGTMLSVIGRAGPHGAIAAAIIGMIVAAPELAVQIIQMFGQKGGPLNLDFRFSQEEQERQYFDRMTQYQRVIGDNPVIRFDDFGYIALTDEDFKGNSLVNANRARTARIGLSTSAYEYIHGV